MEYETYKSSLTGEEIEEILLKSKLTLTDENINAWNDKYTQNETNSLLNQHSLINHKHSVLDILNINSLVTMENLVANGVAFDVIDNGVTKTGTFVKEDGKFILKLTEQSDTPIVEDEYVKQGLLQFVSGANPTDTYGLKDLSGNGNDITISGATASNFIDNKFVNNGTLFGECTNAEFSKMTAMTIIMKLSVVESKPWYALVAFGSFKLMEQGDSKFNLITPANPAWTTNVSMDAFTLGTDIEVAYTITSAGVAKVYINGLYSGTTSYDMSKLSLSSTETLFAMATNDSRLTNAKLSHLMVYDRLS